MCVSGDDHQMSLAEEHGYVQGSGRGWECLWGGDEHVGMSRGGYVQGEGWYPKS